jgi:choline-sulfatase
VEELQIDSVGSTGTAPEREHAALAQAQPEHGGAPNPAQPRGEATPATPPSLVPAPLSRLGEAVLYASFACLVASLPAALRVWRAESSAIGGWLASAAVLLPIAAVFLGLSHAAGRGFRMVTGLAVGRSTALGLALWIGISAPVLMIVATVLKAATNHRGLGGATFGVAALLVVVVAAVVAHRLVGVGRSLVSRGKAPGLVAGGLAGLAILPTVLVSLPLLRGSDLEPHAMHASAALVDGALVTVALALAATLDWPAAVRALARRAGTPIGIALFGLGFGWLSLSPTLGTALRQGGGLAAALVRGLERWTDRDGDGMGSSFGGADCDEGDPRRRAGFDDPPGDGIDQNCDGVDGVADTSAGAIGLAHAATPPGAQAEPAAAAEAVAPTAPPLRARPDLVLITLDTVGAGHSSSYGYAKPTTPRLTALAAEGLLFERVYAPASDTQRAILAVVTGKQLSDSPVDRREWPNLLGAADTLAERLSAAGYATAAVSSFNWISKERGFDQGFERFEEVFKHEHPERGTTGPRALQSARAILEATESDPRPLFLWVHFFDAHERYLRHDGFDFGPGRVGAYDSEVGFVDAQLGALVDSVRASARRKGAIVVVHGSHGEAFGEHGSNGHGRELWEEMVRVPLVVAGPTIGSGQRFAAGAVSTLDLWPTLLELAGLERPAGSGESLVPILRGSGEAPARAPVLIANRQRSAIVDGKLKLIRVDRGKDRKPRLHLFDLEADPGERDDISEKRPDEVLRLLERLERGRGSVPDTERPGG